MSLSTNQPTTPPQNFREESDAISGSWWNGPNGTSVRYSMSVLFDVNADGMIYAVQSQAPSIAPWDALPYACSDRKIIQGFQEPTASLRARLVQWLDRAAYLGRSVGVLLSARGWILPQLPQMAVVTNNGLWWGYADGVDPMPAGSQTVTPPTKNVGVTGWDWDNTPAQWARCWLVIWSTDTVWCTQDGNWGTDSTSWGDGGAWGFNEPYETFAGLPSVVAAAKAKWTLYPYIIVSFSDNWFNYNSTAIFLPDGTWHYPYKIIDTNLYVPSRSTTACYIGGVA